MIGTIRQVLSRRGRKRLLHPVNWGSLRKLRPCSNVFGFDRGTPIDRFYIETFLATHADEIRGHVLEIGDAVYTRRFGGSKVAAADVLHAVAGNNRATLVGDLATGEGIPQSRYDAIILTQTLHTILDFRAALHHAHLALKPGGVLLATLPNITPISRYDMDRWGDYWRFTSRSAASVFRDEFGEGQFQLSTFGNVLAATAFLQGISVEELSEEELTFADPDFEITIAIRAVRAG